MNQALAVTEKYWTFGSILKRFYIQSRQSAEPCKKGLVYLDGITNLLNNLTPKHALHCYLKQGPENKITTLNGFLKLVSRGGGK